MPQEAERHDTQQEQHERLEWERLQNEALAAQRWRLEQEMELRLSQATTDKALPLTMSIELQAFATGDDILNYKWQLAGWFVLLGSLSVAAYTWL